MFLYKISILNIYLLSILGLSKYVYFGSDLMNDNQRNVYVCALKNIGKEFEILYLGFNKNLVKDL